MRYRRGSMTLAAGALMAGSFAPAVAQDGGGVEVVARNLKNPRGVDVGRGGAVFVAEAGKAGKKCVAPGQCYGFSGSITRIGASGHRRVRHGLLSLGPRNGEGTVGSNDVAVGAKRGIFTIVSSAGPKARQVPKRVRRQSGKVLKLAGKGRRRKVASVDRFEFRKNPDRGIVDSNPYSVDLGGPGIAAVDAGGNSLIRISNGKKRLITTFPQRTFGGQRVDSVPTSVAWGPDGNYYVSELGGEATPPGRARVWQVTPQGQRAVFSRGYDTLVGIDVDADGNVYVVELLRDGFAQFATGDLTGSLFRIEPNGDSTELAEGRLKTPGGVAVAANGDVYVSVNSLSPRAGRVVRIPAT
jgi:hypothetical protein